MNTDGEIGARLVAGEIGALADAYDRHGAYVYGVAVRVTGSRATAEEITQNLFADLWARPQSYDPALGSLRGWLVSRALHESAMRARVS
ncbi:sigma factor [Nonomuraea spiralis]|uniref:sigma factor n=1 Tax=Nonomuraea spiralis TaxID=46182 RepID=UPI0037A40576